MSDNVKQSTTSKPKEVYLVHLESGSVSVEASSLEEALKLAKSNKKDEEK